MIKELTKEEIAKQVYPDVEGYLDQVEHDRLQFIKGLEYSDQNTKPLIDEIADYKERVKYAENGHDLCYKELEELRAENAKLKALKSEANEWISVEDRLPIFNEKVLVFGLRYSSEPIIGEYINLNKNGNIFLTEICETNYITHWMLLPKPPIK